MTTDTNRRCRRAGSAASPARLPPSPIPSLKTSDAVVDEFNALLTDLFNLASGNLPAPGGVLTWHVWFTEPQRIDRQERRTHAERWRGSIDADHGSPDGPGTNPRHFDVTPFRVGDQLIEAEIDRIPDYLKKHSPGLAA